MAKQVGMPTFDFDGSTTMYIKDWDAFLKYLHGEEFGRVLGGKWSTKWPIPVCGFNILGLDFRRRTQLLTVASHCNACL